LPSFAVGVIQCRKHEQPSTLVVSAQTTRPDFNTRRGVAQSLKPRGKPIGRPWRFRSDTGRVLADDVGRPYFADNSQELLTK
jgi:hypothetical protein